MCVNNLLQEATHPLPKDASYVKRLSVSIRDEMRMQKAKRTRRTRKTANARTKSAKGASLAPVTEIFYAERIK